MQPETLSVAQQQALAQANVLLQGAGLDPVAAVPARASLPPDPLFRDTSNTWKYPYDVHPSRPFSSAEILAGANEINRQRRVSALVDHPIGAIVEYPETGWSSDVTIAHRFAVDPLDLQHPKSNIQYSLGGTHGGVPDMHCGRLLCDLNGNPVACNKLQTSCQGIKTCEFRGSLPLAPLPLREHSLQKTIFVKTLAFYCAITETLCTSGHTDELGLDFGGSPDVDDDSECDIQLSKSCHGKLILAYDQYNHPRLECEFRSNSGSHLILRNLQEFDMKYLTALLQNDTSIIASLEQQACLDGYGPLAPCSFRASASEQKQLCPNWHRNMAGILTRGTLNLSSDCKARFTIYTPNNISACPRVVILLQGPHSHPDPFPVKTPMPVVKLLDTLLLELDWKLADATPRKILLDSGFIIGLRRHLQWSNLADPSLSDLHPSLGNSDHVRRHISQLRKIYFPKGIGFEGAQLLVEQHKALPVDSRYVRCAEIHDIEHGKKFELVICMSRAMSQHLLTTAHLSIDTSFKRVHGKWQEFEMESWDTQSTKSVVSARAFTTSQSAMAHLILFTRIFDIAQADTGLPVQFYHIHGKGFRTWIADAHKGQALGSGKFCQKLCERLNGHCNLESVPRPLRELTPYDHLRRFFRLCTIHFKRKIHEIRSHVSPDVASAMYSLISCEPHDIEAAFNVINAGGPKARAWLKDKQDAKFALPAIYRPASLIPLHVWLASPPSTNGNEQAHRNIMRDGIGLTLLGGIMRGLQYDFRIMVGILLQQTFGIHSRDQQSTEYRRAHYSISRQVSSQQRQASYAKKNTAKKSRAPARSRAQAPRQVRDAQPALLLTETIPRHADFPSAPFNPPQNASLTSPQFSDTRHEQLAQQPQHLQYFPLPPRSNGYIEADLDVALQDSTFPSSSNLSIHGSGVIRNEQTHLRFSPYPRIYQVASTRGLDPTVYDPLQSHTQYYTHQPDESDSPFYQPSQFYSMYPWE
ncbi:hypothetical protein B0H34DRAFT_798402 [Crassisporium funariophilum]|nr:hypothetical protein B0H34DRAFT_798402 [Crassisporium funariophilum]